MSTQTAGDGHTGGAEAHTATAQHDWRAIERSPEFRELVERKRRFTIPAAIAFFSWMVLFPAPHGANRRLHALLFALLWPRFNTTGAIVGVLGGLTASLVLIVLSPPVWPGPDSEGTPLGSLALANPAIFSIPIGFVCCWLGTVLSSERGAEREYHELYVRAETGLGAEAASAH